MTDPENSGLPSSQTLAAPAEVGSSWFDAVYDEASRTNDATVVPWVHGHPNRAMVNWFNAVAPSLIRCGARVAVVACALGEDAAELVHRGYDVTAFDCSQRAIAWARTRHAPCAECFVEADLFDLPSRWRHRFDLVVEVDTLEVIAPAHRVAALSAMKDIVALHGHLLVIGRACADAGASTDDDAADDPPWLMSREELLVASTDAGLEISGELAVFDDESHAPPVKRLRGLFAHAGR